MKPHAVLLLCACLLSDPVAGPCAAEQGGAGASPDAVLQAVSAYRFGQSRAPLLEASRMAQAAPREMAPRLAALLGSAATADAKKFACDQLALIGTDAEVPALEKLLNHPELSLAARSALERIPGEASLAALRRGLASTEGSARQGIALALGARRDDQAVPALAALLPEAGAIDALGEIGSARALEALMAAEARLTADARARWSAAALKCAARQQSTGALQTLSQPAQPPAIRSAAFIGLATAQGEKGADLLMAALTGSDETLRSAAIRALRESKSSTLLRAAAQGLGRLPEDVRAQLIVVLGERGNAAALPGILAEASSPDEAVRRAALDAIGALGDASAVPALLGLLEKADATGRKAAAEALGRLRGEGVDEALAAALRTASPAAQEALIRSLTERDAKSAVPAVLDAATSPEAGVRQEAIRALNKMAGADAGPRMIALLDRATDADRAAIEAALVALYRRANAVAPLAAAAGGASGATKGSLLTALGALGGPEALGALQAALKDDDATVRTAAVRALANWPDAAPAGDLVAAAEASDDPKIKALALRGVARMVPPAAGLDRARKKDLLQRGIAASGREEETALLQGALALATSSNLALGATATNTDGLKPDHDGRGPEAAIDGDPATYWDETDGQKRYGLKVQLRRPAKVSALRITGFSHHAYAPKDFEVLCDGQPVKAVRDGAYAENVLAVDLPPTRCSAVELKITGCYGASPAIRELEILGEEE
jgi:HEAT repeat protein